MIISMRLFCLDNGSYLLFIPCLIVSSLIIGVLVCRNLMSKESPVLERSSHANGKLKIGARRLIKKDELTAAGHSHEWSAPDC